VTSVRPTLSAHPEHGRRAAESKGSRAFTLLEVMISLAILASALLAISQLTSAALRNHERAIRLEIATLLARGKLAALQDDYQKDGFSDFDQVDEGSFEAEGHPEVRWKAEAKKPAVELGPDQILAVLTGTQGQEGGLDLASLLGTKAQTGADQAAGIETLFPGAAALAGGLRAQLTTIGEQIKKGLREIRLTVSWKEGTREESFTVVTHLVVFAGGSAQ
jgi:general secretion pathway protein I